MKHNLDVTEAHIFRLSTSPEKGEKKQNTDRAYLIEGQGIDGDAHSLTDRPVSLLPYESFRKLENPDLKINPGDFAENITTIGLNFKKLTIGTRIMLGDSAMLEVIQIGKECHHGCIIRDTVGDCIMPTEGVFARVLYGGEICRGDSIKIIEGIA